MLITLPELSSELLFSVATVFERAALISINTENKSIRLHKNLGNCEDSVGYVKLTKSRSEEITVIANAKNISLDLFFIEIIFTPELNPPLKKRRIILFVQVNQLKE